MTRGKKFVLLLAFGLVVGIAVWSFKREREPSYQGKSLSEWCENIDVFHDVTSPATENAIRTMGTNSIPFLLKWIRYEPPSWLEKADSTLERLTPDSVYNSMMRPFRQSFYAAKAFELLGTNATAAIPELTRLMHATNNVHSSSLAAIAMGSMGIEALPPLLHSLAQPHPPSSVFRAISSMGYLGTNTMAAIPILIEHTRQNDHHVAQDAIRCLGRLELEPQTVVPVLTNLLGATNEQALRLSALYALKHFGSRATSAIPAILRVTTDADDRIRSGATNALLEIAPELLTNSVSR
jgi:HEAT repeat protein